MTNCLHDMGWTSLAKPASPIIGWGKDSNCIVEPSLQTPLLAVNWQELLKGLFSIQEFQVRITYLANSHNPVKRTRVPWSSKDLWIK